MDTKTKGDVSEAIVTAVLLGAGKVVLKPFGDNQRYDLVLDNGDGTFARVQCKTGRVRGATIVFNTCSNHYHRASRTSRDYRGEIDLFAVYCPDNGQVYLMAPAQVGKSKGHLRLTPSNNPRVKMATNYEFAGVVITAARRHGKA